MKRQELEEIVKEYETCMTFEEWDAKYHVIEESCFSVPEGEESYLWTKIHVDSGFRIIIPNVWSVNSMCWYRTEFPYNGKDDIITDEFFVNRKERLLSELED